jgi:hypothetical protein
MGIKWINPRGSVYSGMIGEYGFLDPKGEL